MTSPSTPSGIAGFSRDPDDVERRVQQWAEGFASKAERYKVAQEQTEQIRLTATSPHGVRVTVSADGTVTALEFTEKIRSMPLPELSAQILATMRSAQSGIARRVGEVMTEHLGDEDEQTRAMMLGRLREKFPEQPDEPGTDDPAAGNWDYDDEEPAEEPPAPPRPAAVRPPERKRVTPEPDEDEDDAPW